MSALKYAGLAGGATVGFLAAGPAGALIGGAVGYLVGSGASSDTGTVPSPSPEPTPTPEPEPTPTKGPRTRVVDSSTAYPALFAAKYGGAAGKWVELPSANPGMSIVDHVQWQDTDDVWQDSSPEGYVPPGRPSRVIKNWGITPWSLGQVVTLPDSWPG